MNIKNTNYLEFNRDLFLCNSIRDIANGKAMPMITSDRNEVYYLNTNTHNFGLSMPFIDKNWNIYVRPLNVNSDNGAKAIIGPRIGPPTSSSMAMYYYKQNINYGFTVNAAKDYENNIFNNKSFDVIKELKDGKVDYDKFIKDFEMYLKYYDVYVGPGEITFTDAVVKQEEKEGLIYIIKTPAFYSIENGTLNWFDPNFKGQCENYNLQTNCKILSETDSNDVQQNQETCEICKNFQYRDWFDENEMNIHGVYAKNKDTSQEYIRSWLQTWNLGIGIILLTTGIYYQLKK